MITLLLSVVFKRWPEVKRGLFLGSAIGLGVTLGQYVSETWFHHL